ncbi:MAG: Ig-like domain-containing protein, partial [Bacteroidales bacterium]|nr:Ig-like domain-containing protein [Bacteroidales bacterium]
TSNYGISKGKVPRFFISIHGQSGANSQKTNNFMKKNPLIAVTLFAILLSFISCHDSQQEIILEIHPSEVNLLKGEFYDLNTWNSMWDDNLSVVWSSSNSSIVSVDETGKIHALQEGEAQIIAQTENASASCNVVVEFDSLMCPSNLYLTLGEKLNLESPNYFYNFASHTYTDLRPIVLTSSNEEVIGITAQGEVEAKSIGKAVITITAGEVLSASCFLLPLLLSLHFLHSLLLPHTLQAS